MRHAEKDRDPNKARKRAKNDARTALRKLRAWAEELGDVAHAEALAGMLADVDTIAAHLEEASA